MSISSAYNVRIENYLSESINMDYAVIGSGKKNLVIIPGLSVKKVTPAAEAVAKQYEVFLRDYTLYLFDRNDAYSDYVTVERMAEDTAQVITSLGLRKCDVFGASQGGAIAMCLASAYPELVNSMVLGSTFARTNEISADVFKNWIELATQKDEEALLSDFVDRLFSSSFSRKFGSFIINANTGITDFEYSRFMLLTRAVQDFDITGILENVKCPVLVIGCEGDRIVTVQASVEISEKIPHCGLYIYGSNFGHAVYDEAPDYVERCYAFFTGTARED